MSLNTPSHRQFSQALSRNNAYNSSSFNGLLWILEWAEWSIILREQIYDYLKTFYPIPLNPDTFCQNIDSCTSLRDAVSYVASVVWNTWNVQEDINNIINLIQTKVLNTTDLSESAVIRLCALNRVQLKLNNSEKTQLNTIENTLLDFIERRVPTMYPLLNFKNETDAQRIQKIIEIVNYLSKNVRDFTIPENYETIILKLKPLHDLDSEYHNLNHARNNFYKIQQWYGEVVVLNSGERESLNWALKILTWKNLEEYLSVLPKNDTLELEDYLQTIKTNNNDIDNKLQWLSLSVSDFERYYLFYISQENLKRSKIRFDTKKKETFWDKTRDFETDVKKWREIQRNRLVGMAQEMNLPNVNPIVEYLPDDRWEMIVNVLLPLIDENTLQSAENIFERDRKLFLRTWHAFTDIQLHSLLLLILGRRFPNTHAQVIENLSNAIMDENDVTNELYYGDRTTLIDSKDDSGMQRFLKSTWNAGRNIQKVEKYTTPFVKWFTKLAQKSLELTWKTVGSVLSWTTGSVNSVLWKYNTWANAESKWFFKTIWKLPFKASQILTRPLWWWSQGVDFVTKKTISLTAWTYTWLNDVIKNASDNKIDSLFDIFTKTYAVSLWLLGKSVEWSWDTWFDTLKTFQKREILNDFYRTSNIQEMGNMLDSLDISARIKDSSPYIFDTDSFDNLPFNIEKEKKDEFKLLKEKLGERLEEIRKTALPKKIIDLFTWVVNELWKKSNNATKGIGVKSKINIFITTCQNEITYQNGELWLLHNELISRKNDVTSALAALTWAWAPPPTINMATFTSRVEKTENEISKKEESINDIEALWFNSLWVVIKWWFLDLLKKVWNQIDNNGWLKPWFNNSVAKI